MSISSSVRLKAILSLYCTLPHNLPRQQLSPPSHFLVTLISLTPFLPHNKSPSHSLPLLSLSFLSFTHRNASSSYPCPYTYPFLLQSYLILSYLISLIFSLLSSLSYLLSLIFSLLSSLSYLLSLIFSLLSPL